MLIYVTVYVSSLNIVMHTNSGQLDKNKEAKEKKEQMTVKNIIWFLMER